MADETYVVVPEKARQYMLKRWHKEHLGRDCTYWVSMERYFWIDMKEEITKLIENCLECAEVSPGRNSDGEKRASPEPKPPMEDVH